MPFVELYRCFTPIDKDWEPDLDATWSLGPRFGWGLSWPELLKEWRVVLLAEASSGKTEEFRQRAAALSKEEKAAFFIPIEILADGDISDALSPSQIAVFNPWFTGQEEGWFFLDSVDEARLKQKSVETALRRLTHKLGDAIARAHVLVSCRASDWKGQADRIAIEDILKVPGTRGTDGQPSPDFTNSEHDTVPLLEPIFGKREKTVTLNDRRTEQVSPELCVVRLIPLTSEQRQALAGGCGIQDIDAFIQAIDQLGLKVFAERPGDLLELVDYWKQYGDFSSLTKMTEHGITRKLEEINSYRPDNDTLSLEKARSGVERLATALTLGQSLTLRAPAQEPDPELAAGALDAAHLLTDGWTPAERNALLRRGIFVPSTYGRVRFHHRSTQEYLTAAWLYRLQREGCPKPEIWNLLFAERYGVATVVPSLRPAAAWLALKDADLANEIIRREPLVLFQHGDPRSLPLSIRKRLLRFYAEKQARGEIAHHTLHHRNLWMFADQALADTIREVWNFNERPEFRDILLHLIAEGTIIDCVDLARSVAHNETAGDYERIVALKAMHHCQDRERLACAAGQLMADPGQAGARLASGFAEILFPDILSVEDILTLIAMSQPEQEYTVTGFSYILHELYERCPDADARTRFVSGIADLCLAPPFVSPHECVSKRYKSLPEHLLPIARHIAQGIGNREPPSHLVKLLMAIERAKRDSDADGGPPLAESVQRQPKLNRALFWADVEETRAHRDHPSGVTAWWSVRFEYSPLWTLDATTLPWLYEDLSGRALVDDQRVALSAIVTLLRKEERLEAEAPRLRQLTAGRQILEADLERDLAPPPLQDEESRWQREDERRKQRKEEEEEKAKASWVEFRKHLLENPLKISDPAFVATDEGFHVLYSLTKWLILQTDGADERASLHWPLLEKGFSRAIAGAYQEGMKVLWRLTAPERPKREDRGTITVKWATRLSYAGVAIEANERSDWAAHLTEEEAELAARHSCMAEQGYPEWMHALVQAYPDRVLPVLRKELEEEWTSNKESPLYFLYHYARSPETIPPGIQPVLLGMLLGEAPQKPNRLEHGIRIIQKLDLNDADRRRIVRISRRRMWCHIAVENTPFVLLYLACLLLLDVEHALADLTNWLDTADAQEQRYRVEHTFSRLFGRDGFIMSLAHIPIAGMEALLRLTYRHIRLEEDNPLRTGVYTPNARDGAEDARNIILKALTDRREEEAYRALLRLSEEEHFRPRSIRYKELAHSMAERDAELTPWSDAEILRFEKEHTAPVKSGADLLRVAMKHLEEITHDFTHADASSRYVLKTAEDEPAVQHWLAEQLRLRAQNKFHVIRENEVADKKEPDITLSSTSAPPCEVAVEVKRGDSWTVRQLEEALCRQLATKYLKPASRRQGVLVVTYQGEKGFWQHSETRKRLHFPDLIAHLESQAAALTEIDERSTTVRVVGINAC
jgi:hypothetical protein